MKGTWWIRPEQLDDYQRKAISLGLEGNYLVTGPPGSGKTNLLVLRADYLAKSNQPNYLFLVFSRTLEEFIAHCPAQYSIEREKLKTLTRWEMELINHLGGTPAVGSDFEENRRSNCRILTSLIDEQKLANTYSALLLDESQDYWVEEIELLSRLSKNLFAVGDSRQQIYSHDDPIPTLEGMCEHLALPFHYRNGRQICDVADGVGAHWTDYQKLAPTSQYNEAEMPSKTSLIECDCLSSQLDAAIKAIPTQMKAYPDEMIGVICTRREEFDRAKEAFAKATFNDFTVYQGGADGYVSFGEKTRVCVCTVHGAKGLEFRCTHVVGAEHIPKFRKQQRRLIYTALTRAKTILDVYHSKPPSVAGYIEGAFAAAGPRTQPPSIEDLF